MLELSDKDIGKKIGTSDWIVLSQTDVNVFGAVTRDIDPFHMNPDFARHHSPFKTTIVYGFQTLSMLTYFCHEVLKWPVVNADNADEAMALNYGLDRVRFLEPVPVGSRVRCHMTLTRFERKKPGELIQCFACEVEIEGKEKPALVAEWLGMVVDTAAVDRLDRDLGAAS